MNLSDHSPRHYVWSPAQCMCGAVIRSADEWSRHYRDEVAAQQDKAKRGLGDYRDLAGASAKIIDLDAFRDGGDAA